MINKFKYQIDLAYPRSIDLTVMHGESIELDIDITINGEPWTSTSNAIELLWQDPSMGDSWYTTRASRTGSTVTVDWKGSMDTGAELYRWFIRLTGPGEDQSYRVYGKFRMQKSPGFVPNQLPKPTNTLDFRAFTVINAPYYTKTYLDAELNSINTRLTGHDEEIDELRKVITGGANESLKQHEENHNNPHKVKVEQLTKKSASAGACGVVWGASNYYKQGEARFYFDPAMYRKGYGFVQITMPEYMFVDGVDISGVSVDYYGNFVFADEGNHSGWIFRSTETRNVNGLELYIFVSINVPDLLKRESSYAVWVGIGTTTNPTDYSHSAEIVTASFDGSTSYSPITNSTYEQSGIYKVLTEEILRDKKTGLPYTLAVENGQLRLVRYTENEFE